MVADHDDDVDQDDRAGGGDGQVSLTHSCWLLAYPLAGWLAVGTSLPVTAAVLGSIALAAAVCAMVIWPAHDPAPMEHLRRPAARSPAPR